MIRRFVFWYMRRRGLSLVPIHKRAKMAEIAAALCKAQGGPCPANLIGDSCPLKHVKNFEHNPCEKVTMWDWFKWLREA